MLRLLAIHDNEEQIFALPEEECRLGSASGNDIVLRARGVSRRHALLRRLPGGLEVVDLGSKNGLFVEGRRVRRSVLTPGLRVQIGSAWLELEEVSSSEETLARMVQASMEEAELLQAETLTRGPETDPRRKPDLDAALALAYCIAQLGVGLPGRRTDLLARIRATLGADAFMSFEARRRGRLCIWEGESEFLPEERKLLGSLAAEAHVPACGAVILKRAGRLLLAGRNSWFLGARFAEESRAQDGWRKDFLRFLAHHFFLPVRSLEDLDAAESQRVLALLGGNKRRTAALLGISRGTLYSYLNRRISSER